MGKVINGSGKFKISNGDDDDRWIATCPQCGYECWEVVVDDEDWTEFIAFSCANMDADGRDNPCGYEVKIDEVPEVEFEYDENGDLSDVRGSWVPSWLSRLRMSYLQWRGLR